MTDEEIEARLVALEAAVNGKGEDPEFSDPTLELDKYVPILGGGGDSVDGVFEPVFDSDGKLSGVGQGYYPYGRKYLTVVTVAESAKVKTGVIGLRIAHGESAPTSAEIVLVGQSIGSILNESLTETIVPLYYVEDGAIAIDCRSVMSMPVRE